MHFEDDQSSALKNKPIRSTKSEIFFQFLNKLYLTKSHLVMRISLTECPISRYNVLRVK